MTPIDVGPFRGEVAEALRNEETLARLATLSGHLAGGTERAGTRSRVVSLDLCGMRVAVKAFPVQGAIGSWQARRGGSKARRSWEMARALQRSGVGTPPPVAYLERWEGKRLVESYFVSEFIETSSLHDELLQLYHFEPRFQNFYDLLEAVATAARKMHDAGIQHGDMGNQNILLRRDGDNYGDVGFLDLNRGRVRGEPLSLRRRAFDLSRLTLPSRFVQMLRRCYCGKDLPARALGRWERFYRFRFFLHSKTRRWRHPIRSRRREKEKAHQGELRYPRSRDIWIWDERGGQAWGAMIKWERYLQRNLVSNLKETWATVVWLVPILAGYVRMRRRCYRKEVSLEGRIAMSLSPKEETAERELEVLRRLGKIPVLIRFYHHETQREWDFLANHVRRLHKEGFPIAIALIQDRRAVLDPPKWHAFAESTLDRVGDVIEWVEIGHAINRKKWGIWSVDEYARLARPFIELKKKYGHVRFMGPAVNDFEFHYLPAGMAGLPRGLHLDALSLHLYVDRRGAPENAQYGLSSVDKFAMARAFAGMHPRVEKRAIVSEVNWFLQTDWFEAHVTEDEYADFMIRYFLIAICSGMIERVYWWRLVARDFGLLDDADPENWRERPALGMLATFLDLLGESTFVGFEKPARNIRVYRFRRPDGSRAAVAYAREGEPTLAPPLPDARLMDAFGKEREMPEKVTLTGRPVYFVTRPPVSASSG